MTGNLSANAAVEKAISGLVLFTSYSEYGTTIKNQSPFHRRYAVRSTMQKWGGAPKSEHPKRTAVDFTVRGVAPEQVQDLIDEWYPNSLGLGRYNNFTHVDTRKGKARW